MTYKLDVNVNYNYYQNITQIIVEIFLYLSGIYLIISLDFNAVILFIMYLLLLLLLLEGHYYCNR